jgi:hypothetical protein
VSNTLAFALLGISGSVAAFRAASTVVERHRARRAIRARPVLAPTTADGAVVQVTGVVRELDTLEAPLTGHTCVVHRSRARSRALLLRRTAEVFQLTPFVLDRGEEGLVLVEGTAAQLDVRPVLSGRHPERLRALVFLRTHGAVLPDSVFSYTGYEEVIVEPGQRVTVAGLVMMDPAAEPDAGERGYRDEARPRLRITGNADHPLAIGDARD